MIKNVNEVNRIGSPLRDSSCMGLSHVKNLPKLGSKGGMHEPNSSTGSLWNNNSNYRQNN